MDTQALKLPQKAPLIQGAETSGHLPHRGQPSKCATNLGTESLLGSKPDKTHTFGREASTPYQGQRPQRIPTRVYWTRRTGGRSQTPLKRTSSFSHPSSTQSSSRTERQAEDRDKQDGRVQRHQKGHHSNRLGELFGGGREVRWQAQDLP